jgi:imidazoleglycerol-phosphate dehydratase
MPEEDFGIAYLIFTASIILGTQIRNGDLPPAGQWHLAKQIAAEAGKRLRATIRCRLPCGRDFQGVEKKRGKAMRQAEVTRKTKETDVTVKLNLDGTGESSIASGIGFFDHMLTLFAKHGHFDLQLRCQGDLDVDGHHTVEDVGLALGEAIAQAIGAKEGIARFGTFYVPMDEALCRSVVDLSGRAFLVCKAEFPRENMGEMNTELVEEFFRALATQGRMNLHIEVLYGKNCHHMAEAMFKATARALAEAVRLDSRVQGIPSTKGILK